MMWRCNRTKVNDLSCSIFLQFMTWQDKISKSLGKAVCLFGFKLQSRKSGWQIFITLHLILANSRRRKAFSFAQWTGYSNSNFHVDLSIQAFSLVLSDNVSLCKKQFYGLPCLFTWNLSSIPFSILSFFRTDPSTKLLQIASKELESNNTTGVQWWL